MIALALRYWKPLAGAAALLAIILALWWLRADAYRDGVRATDAKWAAAAARLEAAANKASAAAATIATAREAENASTIKDLRHEATKGTAEPVGPGTRAVLERMRATAGR